MRSSGARCGLEHTARTTGFISEGVMGSGARGARCLAFFAILIPGIDDTADPQSLPTSWRFRLENFVCDLFTFCFLSLGQHGTDE